MCLLKSFSLGPSGRPKFIRERLSTSSTSLSLVWAPPPPSTLNAEFRGYELTYKPTNYITENTTKLHISVKDPISIQVNKQNTLKGLIIYNILALKVGQYALKYLIRIGQNCIQNTF